MCHVTQEWQIDFKPPKKKNCCIKKKTYHNPQISLNLKLLIWPTNREGKGVEKSCSRKLVSKNTKNSTVTKKNQKAKMIKPNNLSFVVVLHIMFREQNSPLPVTSIVCHWVSTKIRDKIIKGKFIDIIVYWTGRN